MDNKTIIAISVPYILIVRDRTLRDYTWVDERVINEGLREPNEMKTIEIDESNMRLVDYIKETYLSYLREETWAND